MREWSLFIHLLYIFLYIVFKSTSVFREIILFRVYIRNISQFKDAKIKETDFFENKLKEEFKSALENFKSLEKNCEGINRLLGIFLLG